MQKTEILSALGELTENLGKIFTSSVIVELLNGSNSAFINIGNRQNYKLTQRLLPKYSTRMVVMKQAADVIATPSRFTVETFAARHIAPANVQVSPLGADASRFGVVVRPVRNRLSILFVGRIGLLKSAPWILRGFARGIR